MSSAKVIKALPATERRGGEQPYGSDSSGLIWGFLFASGQDPRPLDSSAVLAWLGSRREAQSTDFIWLHFSLSNALAEKWLRANFSLPEQYFETMREGPGSTQVELADDDLIAVINDVTYDFSYDASQIATLCMCVQHDVVISARLHPLRSVDRLRAAAKAGERFPSPVSLLVHLLRDQAQVLQQIGRDASTRVDEIEDNLLSGRVTARRATLGSLRRVFVRLRRLLAPEPGTLFRLLNRPPEWFEEDDAQELRAATEEFSAVLNDLASLQERTKLLQEEIAAHTTEQTNRSVFLLTIATVIALPINIIAGLFGMNVGGIPMAQEPAGFWVILGFVFLFTCLAGWYAFIKQRD